MKDAVEAKTGHTLGRNTQLFSWLVEWAADSMNRYKVMSNGKTPFNMVNGRERHARVAGFGERILYMPLRSRKQTKEKLEMKLQYGHFIGISMRTDELLIGTSDGVVKARTIKRLIENERLQWRSLSNVKGTPTFPVPGGRMRIIPISTKECQTLEA